MRFYTTCPPSSAYTGDTYAERVRQVCEWSEQAGAEGVLIYSDNSLVDPWVVADHLLGVTERLIPMIATQPIYMTPYMAAKRIASIAMLHGRKVALNMIAGGFKKDLRALGDDTPHDDRYLRLEEYTLIVLSLLRGGKVSFEGRYHTIDNVTLAPETAAKLVPEIFLSSSSDAGRAAAAAIGATPVSYPLPPHDRSDDSTQRPTSVIRLGIIARETAREAWTIARARFPKDPRGAMMHRMATAASDSAWHKMLDEIGQKLGGCEGLYWMHPFQTYRTFCPYLIGAHDDVGAALRDYQAQGVEGLILDVPATADDLSHTQRALGVGIRKHPETTA